MLENLTCVVGNVFECVSIELHTFNRKTAIISCIYRQPVGKIDDLIRKVKDLKNQEIKRKHVEATIFFCLIHFFKSIPLY